MVGRHSASLRSPYRDRKPPVQAIPYARERLLPTVEASNTLFHMHLQAQLAECPSTVSSAKTLIVCRFTALFGLRPRDIGMLLKHVIMTGRSALVATGTNISARADWFQFNSLALNHDRAGFQPPDLQVSGVSSCFKVGVNLLSRPYDQCFEVLHQSEIVA